MTNTIHEYHPTQQKWVEIFCNDFYNKGKSRRLFNALLHQGKRWWTYGVAAIVAHAVTGHSLFSRGSGGIGISSSTRFLSTSSNSITSTTHTLMVELTLWTAGFGLAWYTWLSHLYVAQVKERTKKLMVEMDRVRLEPKSNVWLMIDNKSTTTENTLSNGRVLGMAMLKCHQVATHPAVVEEGQIQVVAASGSRIELALVENAIQFARQQGIKVITQDHKKNRLDSFF